MQRGPRPLPTVHALARDILSGLEHAHSRGIIVRRIVPASLLVNLTGRGTVTDLRFCSYTLAAIPRGRRSASGMEFMAPEVRDGARGDPASDVFTAGAILYYAITGREPPLDPARPSSRPSELRPTLPEGHRPDPAARAPARRRRPLPHAPPEMLEDFASDAGTFDEPAASVAQRHSRHDQTDDGRHWEKRLRRALGDDYELLRGPRQRADSAGSTGCATCTSSARWRSRCCTPYLTAEPAGRRAVPARGAARRPADTIPTS